MIETLVVLSSLFLGAPAEPAPRPRLVVLVVVDQMRADYLDRFAPLFGGGLLRFRQDGVRFTGARHLHATTATGPGHATIATGAHPARHGIVSNVIPAAEPGAFRAVALDASRRNLNRDAAGASPDDLLATALGDWIKAADSRSRVVALSFKTRAAVMLGGKHPDACAYVDTTTGEFTTSSYYAEELPAWLARFNREQPASAHFGKVWEPRVSDERFQAVGATADDMPFEGRFGLEDTSDRTFPHTMDEVGDLTFAPFGDERILALAAAALDEFQLGQDDAPDLLAISLSAADYIGHAYGPDSREMADYYAWLDAGLGEFLDAAERAAPPPRVLFVLTADHGVSPIVEHLLAQGVDAGRIRPATIVGAVDTALDELFGAEDWVFGAEPDVYLDGRVVARRGLDARLVQDAAAHAAKSVHGIRDAFPRHRLLEGDATVPAAFLRSFNGTRSGDVVLAFENHFHFDYLDVAPYVKANHMTRHDYDQRVPVVFLGGGLPASIRNEPFATIDIAPTLAAALGVAAPDGVDGAAVALAPGEEER